MILPIYIKYTTKHYNTNKYSKFSYIVIELFNTQKLTTIYCIL